MSPQQRRPKKNKNTFYVFFQLFSTKNSEMTISTSVWGAQHPKAGQNIQHLEVEDSFFALFFCCHIRECLI